MPSARYHLLFATAIFAGLSAMIYFVSPSFLGSFEYFMSLPLLGLYAVLPDIDTWESKIGKVFAVSMMLAIGALFFLQLYILALVAGLIFLATVFTGHRGWFHSLTAGSLFSLPLFFIDLTFGSVALIGYISHLILDRSVKVF